MERRNESCILLNLMGANEHDGLGRLDCMIKYNGMECPFSFFMYGDWLFLDRDNMRTLLPDDMVDIFMKDSDRRSGRDSSGKDALILYSMRDLLSWLDGRKDKMRYDIVANAYTACVEVFSKYFCMSMMGIVKKDGGT